MTYTGINSRKLFYSKRKYVLGYCFVKYRDYFEQRCKSLGQPHPEWKEWIYNAVKACVLYKLYRTFEHSSDFLPQDTPKQTNSIDCGIFISQVSIDVLKWHIH